MICLIIINLITGIAASIGTIMTSAYIGNVINQWQLSPSAKTANTLLFFLAMLIVITVIAQYLSQHFANRLSYHIGYQLRENASLYLNTMTFSQLQQKSIGDTAQLLTNDIENISTAIAQLCQQLCYGIPTIIVALYFMAKSSLSLMTVVLLTTPLIFIFMLIVNKLSHRYFKEQQALLAQLATVTEEYIPNETLVQFFNQEAMIQQRFDDLNKQLQVVGRKAQWISSLTNPLSRFVDHLTYLGIGLVGGLLFMPVTQHPYVGILSSFILYAGQFSKPFIELSGLSTQIETARASFERFRAWFTTQERETLPQDYPALAGDIEFHNVSFAYEATHPIIQNLSFTVHEGETLAIIGKTGAGKSTIIQLLLRFYDPNQGDIIIGGKNTAHCPKEQVRQSFGVVLQDPWLFKGTLRDNLTLARAVDDQTIMEALHHVELASFVKRLPHGLDTMIDQNSFSSGERQLLTIARTLIANPKMIILDEATSAVDRLTEKKMMRALQTLLSGRTAIIIAHRLETIQNADHIMVLENGYKVEYGQPQALLQQKGAYYQFYQQQQA